MFGFALETVEAGAALIVQRVGTTDNGWPQEHPSQDCPYLRRLGV
jgi:hypothetical protein